MNFLSTVFLIIGFFSVVLFGVGCAEQPSTNDTLPPPSSKQLVDYEKILYRWLMDRKYAQLAANDTSWAVDKRVRDTGPFINGKNYGVHPAVRIYYSPEVKRWLRNKRKGPVDDGAIIVKEMFLPPAEIYQELKKVDPQGYEEGRAPRRAQRDRRLHRAVDRRHLGGAQERADRRFRGRVMRHVAARLPQRA